MLDNQLQIRRRPVIRVFVSSTFTDLKHERDALQRDLFPKLEQLCASRQFQFQAIDLRWGVPTEASLDHRTMRICFEELRRSQEISPQPNFLILLGNRYGWRPLPEEVSHAEFEKLALSANSGANNPIPGTHGKAALQVLREWYRCDENVVVPDPPEISPDRAPLNYILRPRTQNLGDGRDYTRRKDDPTKDTQDWIDVQQVLWRIINAAFPPEALDHRFDIDWAQHVADVNDRQHPKRAIPQIARFQGSATEQEIWCGALSAVNAEQQVIACFREINNREDFVPAEANEFFDVTEGKFDVLSAKRQMDLKAALRKRLGDEAIVPIPFSRLKREKEKVVVDASEEATKQFYEDVESRLRPIITRQMDEYWGTSDPTAASPRELELERGEHQRFGEERAANFIGRDEKGGPLERIRDYLINNSNQPLVIHGASGCGKTALLAKAVQEVTSGEWRVAGASSQKPEDASSPSTLNSQPSPLIYRLIGVTPRSSDVRSLLASLCQELRQRHPLESPIPGDVRELTKELGEHFRTATAQAPLILFLDALDQLADADNGPSLFWIPQLPGYVKLIVSCLSDRAPEDPSGQPYTALKRRGLAEENFINLDALSEDEAQTLLFERWLPQARRKLNAEQAKCIRELLTSDACRQPLYLKVLFEEARLWRSDDPAPALGNNVSELLGVLFQRLGAPSNHGPTLECALGYIAAARRGLTEMEILEVLYQDSDYAKFLEQMTAKTGHKLPDNPKRIPIAIWSRLRFDLAPYLAEHAAPGGTVLNFYHRQVAEFVRGQFLNTPLKRQQRHERLAGYFDSQDYFLESLEEQRAVTCPLPPKQGQANFRKADELLWQLYSCGRKTALAELLTSGEFVKMKLAAKMMYDLAADYERGMELPEDLKWSSKLSASLKDWQSFVKGSLLVFTLDAEPFLATALNWAESGPVFDDVNRRIEQLTIPWFRRLNPPSWGSGPECVATMEGDYYSVLSIAVMKDGAEAVSGGVDNRVRLLNVQTGEAGLILEGHKGSVNAVCLSPDERWIVSASDDKTLRVWDTDTGECRHVLTGHNSEVKAAVITLDGKFIVSGDQFGEMRLWDLRKGLELSRTRPLFFRSVHALANFGAEHIVAETTIFKVADFLELEETALLSSGKPLWGSVHELRAIAVSANGQLIVAAGFDHELLRWDIQSAKPLEPLKGHRGLVWTVSTDASGRWAASGSDDGTVRVWDLESGEIAHVLGGHAQVRAVAWASNGQLLADDGGMLRIWRVFGGEHSRQRALHGRRVDGVLVSKVGSAVSVSADGKWRLWDLASGKCDKVVRGEGYLPREGPVMISLKSYFCGSAAFAGIRPEPSILRPLMTPQFEIVRRDLGAWPVGGRIGSHPAPIVALAATVDDSRVVSGSEDGTLKIWDVTNGRLVGTLEGHESTPSTIAIAPEGRRAISGDRNGVLCCWDLATRSRLWRRQTHKLPALSLAVTPEGRHVVSAASDYGNGEIALVDFASGEVVERLAQDLVRLGGARVTPDGRFFLAHNANLVQVWDASEGFKRSTLRGHTRTITGIAVLPDGAHIISFGLDRRLHLWDLIKGVCVSSFVANAPLTCGSVVEDGTRVMLGDQNGEVYILEPRNLERGLPCATAVRLWVSDKSEWDSGLIAPCPYCPGCAPLVNASLGEAASCRSCGRSVELNPFICDPSDHLGDGKS